MKEILCYGDSNTWGYTPGTGARYPYHVRWTGLLAEALGKDYHIIENGINGRTTMRPEPDMPWRNGLDGLKYALFAGKQLDLVVLMLGTNDLKTVDAAEAARGAETLVRTMQNAAEVYGYGNAMSPIFRDGKGQILLVSPIHIGENAASEGVYFYREESLRFAACYEAVAKKTGVHFMDAALYARPCPEEGTHLTPEGHRALAKAMEEKIREIFA